jgi:hypothetical protein
VEFYCIEELRNLSFSGNIIMVIRIRWTGHREKNA